jgi:predicted deacylase
MHFHSVHFASPTPGTRLIVLGAVHGNEVCGTIGIGRIIEEFQNGSLQLQQGSVTFVPITNPLAYEKKQRMGDRNLNRNLYPRPDPQDFEDRIANWLCPILAAHDVLLDLHSFHTGGVPFALVGPLDNAGRLEPFAHARSEEQLARCLGVTRFVDGWLDTYAKGVLNRASRAAQGDTSIDAISGDVKYGVGTTEYMRENGGYAVTLECGQHEDPKAPEVAYRAIRNTLVHLGLVAGDPPVYVQGAEALSLCEVIDRAHPDDNFTREWRSFDPVNAGDIVGHRADGSPVPAPFDGLIVFPNPNAKPGQEWFYMARRTSRFD